MKTVTVNDQSFDILLPALIEKRGIKAPTEAAQMHNVVAELIADAYRQEVAENLEISYKEKVK